MKTSIYLQNYERDLHQIRFSAATIKNYSSNVKLFLDYFHYKDSPKHISSEEIKDYLVKVAENSNYQNAVHSSIKKFYDLTIQQKNKFNFIPYAKKEFKIPLVIDMKELKDKLEVIPNIKHKAILTLTASVGLRVSEVINLELKDIDSNNNKINIRNAKGKIDRIVMLDDSILGLMRKYWESYKTKKYLIEGAKGDVYSAKSIQQIVQTAVKKLGITKKISSHSLRHSCFTQLIKNGTDLRTVQKLAGHKNINTTANYIKLIDDDILSTVSPINSIKI